MSSDFGRLGYVFSNVYLCPVKLIHVGVSVKEEKKSDLIYIGAVVLGER